MGLNVDQQFFDLFTAIDNLMKQNNQLQQQNNASQQHIISLLGAILEKPAILEAPRLTELAITQQAISVPENVDIAPQFFVDIDAKRFYSMVLTFYVNGWHDLGPGTTSDSGDFRLSDIIPLELLRLTDFKYVGFNMIEDATNTPANVQVLFYKNKTPVYSFFVLPDESERVFPDRSSTGYNFKPTDTFREVITNYSSALNIRVYHEKHFAIYKEISLDAIKYSIDVIKKIVLL